ncbi:glycosyltransferase family 2 protein [Prevotella sp. AGR2160]|uniref:glycosyltransferase family 2 protein n=1 Tax=Prevotella sp. AGR2160 TaxID=1280674 RepID=UPI0018CB7E26|nr:glycosyltransferase family 2 protein [Prevotella sp. AGR2160]
MSIIIVNYNTGELIKDCIQSIQEKTKEVSYEIIIVDNHSKESIDQFVFSGQADIRIIKSEENLGFGRANNLGAKYAAGRNLFFLNPDTILKNNAIKLLSNYLDQHQEAGACGGNLFDWKEQPTLSYRRILPGTLWDLSELTFHRLEMLLFGNNWQFNHSQHPIAVGYSSGADLMVKKKVFQEAGGFDPLFFMYYEETDLCLQIKRLGHHVINVPQAQIIHLEGKSFVTDPNKKANPISLRYSEQSRRKYYKKNVGTFCRFLNYLLYPAFLHLAIKLFNKNEKALDFYQTILTVYQAEEKHR